MWAGVAAAGEVRVSVAVSLKEAVTEIAKGYTEAGGEEVVLTFGASGQLARQITEGAKADVFIAAANKQVEELVKGGMAEAGTRQVVAGNRLVLVVPAGAKEAPGSIADLAQGKFKKIAIGDPKSVPAGEYAMAVLTTLKMGEQVKGRLVYGTNVRQVLAYVESGDVAGGLVYATDARQSGEKVRVVEVAEEKWHEAIEYPAVVIKGSKQRAGAVKFLEYLKTEAARKVLVEKGFRVRVAAGATTAPATPTTVPGR